MFWSQPLHICSKFPVFFPSLILISYCVSTLRNVDEKPLSVSARVLWLTSEAICAYFHLIATHSLPFRTASRSNVSEAMGKWPGGWEKSTALELKKCAAHPNAITDFLVHAQTCLYIKCIRAARAQVYAARFHHRVHHLHVQNMHSHGNRRVNVNAYAYSSETLRADYTVSRCEKYYPLISELRARVPQFHSGRKLTIAASSPRFQYDLSRLSVI